MDTRELKHEARLIEWEEKVVACRGSGMAVSRWCTEQGIAAKTYYRWEREVLAKAGAQLAAQREGGRPAFVEVRAVAETAPAAEPREGKAVARLHTAVGGLDVYCGADQETLQAIIGALKKC